ncbi:MAG: pyridoxamine 5'-phosphate oxidase family protein [Betaproteobacteria bacterium]|nr:pyridoxamine 5'-phosphate oxidase family protein [Betaproteobacteria bacterium]MDE1954278.1 pyridoxamine 5'-phosphate oxidase family protein [Betaproteobacteria bacterium]MDE2150942.1 pyridoxamine 5'-phosphate oxidase family protein [Betaproteobacteria bacterium]
MSSDSGSDSVFHAGERALQEQAGSRESLARHGARILAKAMPEAHQAFFAQLPWLVLGAADASGQPWCSLLEGAPGFVHARHARSLRVQALPDAQDPLAACLHEGAQAGMLGIELGTRRRNRVNGRVVELDATGFTVEVQQSFGNCPRYIQRREQLPGAGSAEQPQALRSPRLQGEAAALVRRADTLFIATRAAEGQAGGGADASHRGGRPGFVQVDDTGSRLAWADFPGNLYFNTLGNLLLEPRAGLLFPDFASGELVHVAGRAELLDGAAAAALGAAERAVLLHVEQVIHRPGALNRRWRLLEYSPYLPD